MEVQPVFLDKLSTEIRVSYVRAGLRDYLKPRAYITVSSRRRSEGMGLGWNSVFLGCKHFAFTWDRVSCGSGLDFFCPALLHAGLPTYRLAFRYRNRRFISGLGSLLACLWLFSCVCPSRY